MTSKSLAQSAVNAPALCPIGEPQCWVIDQLAAVQKENALLHEQLCTDTLTGLYNYRHFIEILTLEMERTRRTEQPTALIMVDLDYFKQVNDTWGHEAGNTVLVSTAEILRKTTRRLDIPCRYGGEEFTVILPCVDRIVSMQVAERIRAQVEATPVVINGEQVKLTASFGIALFENHQNDTPQELVERADRCLYQAKEQGRNCVRHEIQELDEARLTVSEEEKEALFGIFSDEM